MHDVFRNRPAGRYVKLPEALRVRVTDARTHAQRTVQSAAGTGPVQT